MGDLGLGEQKELQLFDALSNRYMGNIYDMNTYSAI